MTTSLPPCRRPADSPFAPVPHFADYLRRRDVADRRQAAYVAGRQ